MISYGGQALTIPDPATIAMIEGSPLMANLMELQRPSWTGTGDWKNPVFDPVRPVRLGSLVWPRSASRFAYAHYIVSDKTMVELRKAAYSGDSGQTALSLVISSDPAGGTDPLRSITTPMYMLPPRPIRQFVPKGGDPRSAKIDNLNLLTIVDERFYWWRAASNIAVAEGMKWSALYSAIANAVGVILQQEAVDDAYLFASPHLASVNEYLPLMFDAVAYSVGQRVVRALDGTVYAQSYDTASDISEGLYEKYANLLTGKDRKTEGGVFRFSDPKDTRQDLTSLVPASVSMRFPVDAGGFKAYIQDLASLQLDEYKGITVKNDTKIIQSSVIARQNGSFISNEADLVYLLKQWAADWYLWQLGDVSVVLSGIVPWDKDGLSDVVEWHAYAGMSTVVSREPINDLALKVWHAEPSGSGSGSSGSGTCVSKLGGTTLTDLPFWNPLGPAPNVLAEQGGCAVRIPTKQCS